MNSISRHSKQGVDQEQVSVLNARLITPIPNSVCMPSTYTGSFTMTLQDIRNSVVAVNSASALTISLPTPSQLYQTFALGQQCVLRILIYRTGTNAGEVFTVNGQAAGLYVGQGQGGTGLNTTSAATPAAIKLFFLLIVIESSSMVKVSINQWQT